MLEDKMLFRSRFGRVLGTVFGAFWTILGGFWGFENESNFEPKLEAEKVVPETRRGVGRESAGGYVGPKNDR